MIGYIVIIAFLLLGVWYGFRQTLFNTRQFSAAMRLPMSVPYAALPVGFVLMLLVTLEELLTFLAGTGKAEEAEGGTE